MTSRSHVDSIALKFLKGLKHATDMQAGSSHKFCPIAEGSAEVYPRFGRTIEWGVRAGQAVPEAATRKVLTASAVEE